MLTNTKQLPTSCFNAVTQISTPGKKIYTYF